MRFKASFTSPTRGIFEPLCFIEFSLLDVKVLRVGQKQTIWNSDVNTSVTTVDKSTVDEGTAWYTSTTRLLQEYLEEDGASMWVEMRTALLDF